MVERGEPGIDFALPRGPDGTIVRFTSRVGGRPAVVVLAGGDPDRARALVEVLAAGDDVHLGGEGGEPLHGADLHVVVDADPSDPPAAHEFVDHEGRVQAGWGIDVAAGPTAVVLDPAVRVDAVHAVADVDRVAAEVRADVDRVAAAHAAADRAAPVLVVPDAVEPEMAERIVAAWTTADPVATGVETTADGRHVEALDDLRKRRRDHVVTDPALLRELTQHVGRRVIPAVEKAFAFRATGFEGFKIGGYDARDQGFFAAHRDNLSPATAHRRFALSCNLTDDHDGGELVFPEYGHRRHRLAAGEGLVFSGSLLHAVTPVTRGLRLVLLSFLFGRDQPPQRQ